MRCVQEAQTQTEPTELIEPVLSLSKILWSDVQLPWMQQQHKKGFAALP